jgi:short-subunit dehydrogenase
MANELKNDNIICVNVNPGWVQTDMGGQKAQFTTEQAVTNILTNIVSKVSIAESGKFLNFDGSEHPW